MDNKLKHHSGFFVVKTFFPGIASGILMMLFIHDEREAIEHFYKPFMTSLVAGIFLGTLLYQSDNRAVEKAGKYIQGTTMFLIGVFVVVALFLGFTSGNIGRLR
jgi:hypothetical protein